MQLRPALLPPTLDESKVVRLSKLAAALDGAWTEDSADQLAQFNNDAGTSFKAADFQGIYGVCSHESWVRSTLFNLSIRELPDITFDELVEITRRVLTSDGEQEQITFWVNLLTANVPDKRISDLIFWPDEYFENEVPELSAEQIVRIALRSTE